MSVIARGTTKAVPIIYPPTCKEVTDEIGKEELVRRLKLIARAFQDMGQDDYEKFSGLALHLATDFFLEHSNKDVRLLVACCIADVFRIFAPEAPYRDAAHLKDIFMFLIKQLRGLEDPNSPTFKRYFYLLENLAWVKSFNICIELDDNQEIFCSLFKLMFAVINEKHTGKVKNFMLDMMSPLLTEADIVSQELLDILLINIVEPHKSQNRQAYHLAKELLERTCTAIEPFVQAFFNNALMLGKTSESELSEHLYDLIYELNVICPSVLLAVLPQLEFKLKSNEESERKSVTKILSRMFSDPGSNLAELNKPLWNCFLGRFNDISITVRTVCVQTAVNIVLHHPELIKDVVEQVKIRQHDAEETVRQEVVNTLLTIAKKNFDVMSNEMLEIIKERTRDKRFKIRHCALLGLGQLYKVVTGGESVSQLDINKVIWVKDKVFHAYYQTNPDDRILVERLFNICLVPYTLSVGERMKRLFQLYGSLDEPATKAFHEMMKHRHIVRINVKYLLDGLDRMTTNPKEHVAFLPKLQQIAKTLPDQNKPLDQLKKLNEMMREDRRLRSLMRYLVSSECYCRKANDNVKEILKRLGGGSSNSSQSQMLLYNTVKALLERVAPVMVDSQAITVLVKHIEDAVKGHGTIADDMFHAGEKGVALLLCMSTVFPQYFKGEETFDILISFLKDEDEVVADTTLQIFTNCGEDLAEKCPSILTKLVPILQHTAKIGNPKQSKHSLRCINKIAKNKEAVLTQVFEYVKNNLKPESANYITSIVALGHISNMCPEEYEQHMKLIVSKDIVKDLLMQDRDLLMQDRTHGEPVMDSWYSDHLVTEETNAKMQAMKLLMRWLLGLKNNTNNCCMSTLRLLYTVIVHEGDLMEKGLINKPELARLRLQAGCVLLKLAEEPVFADLIEKEQFQALALLINDSCYHVRVKFAEKLHKGLFSMKLPLEYMAIFSLAANDPVRERRTGIKRFIQLNVQRRRDYLKQNSGLGGKMFRYLPDFVMPYTIHLLAHDPDLKSFKDIQALKNIKECLWFIMEPLVARSEDYNYHFFRRLIENIKQAKDMQSPEDEDTNKKMYAVTDLAVGLLQKNLTNIVLKDSNVDPVLPSKLFTKPDKSTINNTIYLPKDFNFEKKKGLTDAATTEAAKPSTSGTAFYRGRRRDAQPTLETIIVKSPGPVVNPHPTCPREPKAKKVKEDTDDTQSTESESPPKRPTRRRGRAASAKSEPVEEDEEEESDEEEDEEDMEEPSTPEAKPAKSTAAKKGAAARNVRGAATKGKKQSASASQETSVQSDSADAMDGSSQEADHSVTQTSSDISTPPKKRLLKRTMAESSSSSSTASQSSPSQQTSNKRSARKSTDSESVSYIVVTPKSKVVSAGPVTKKGAKGPAGATQKKVVNGANKGKGVKRAAPEPEPEPESEESEVEAESEEASEQEEEEEEEEEVASSKKKRKFNLEKDAVPAPKLGGKRAAAGRSTSTTTTDSAASTPPSKKAAVVKKGATGKGPKAAASATLTAGNKNVRRAKPLANGTSASDTDASNVTPKKGAAALSKAIQKGNLGKNTKKPAAAKGKKK